MSLQVRPREHLSHHSLEELLIGMLKDAKVAHTNEVDAGHATDEDWPNWYGQYMAKRLATLCTSLQGRGWIDPSPVSTVSNLHVGE